MDDYLFSKIAGDISAVGYSINPGAISIELANSLIKHLHKLNEEDFHLAGIGRENQAQQNTAIRSDEIYWITDQSEVGRGWLQWVGDMQAFLNRQLFLGLFSFESHFAHYGPGDFYRRHQDAFKGETNRILSLVVYLNADWSDEDGGQLVLYSDDNDTTGISVIPDLATVVLFLSEDFPHEVLPARRDRYSITGWFRVNSSTLGRVDPPL